VRKNQLLCGEGGGEVNGTPGTSEIERAHGETGGWGPPEIMQAIEKNDMWECTDALGVERKKGENMVAKQKRKHLFPPIVSRGPQSGRSLMGVQANNTKHIGHVKVGLSRWNLGKKGIREGD